MGPSPFWKAADQHIINDRWLVDVQWSHLGNNFILDFHEDGLDSVQPIFVVSTSAWSRSYRRSGPFIRPTMSFDVNTSYFLPAFLNGDHTFKAGFRYRTAKEHSEAHRGGNTEIRLLASGANQADLWRDSVVDYTLDTQALYLQDTYTWNRVTMNLGFRWDRQTNKALASSVPGHPFLEDWLPPVTFAGADSPFAWNDFSPRLGLNYDFSGSGKTVAKASFAMYYGQLAPNQGVSALNPVTEASIRFPWTDANGDMIVQRNELTLGRANVLTFSGNYNPDNPTFLGTNGSVDPNVSNDRTQEFIVGLDHELARNLAISGNYIWRKYDRFFWNDRVGLTSAEYVARSFTPTPTATTCVAPGTRCETVTYFEPTLPIPAQFVYTNVPDRYRNYNGIELVLTKRYSDRWMGSNVSLRVQRRYRLLGFGGGVRGSDQPRTDKRRAVRAGVWWFGYRQRLHEREVARQGERDVHAALLRHQPGGQLQCAPGVSIPAGRCGSPRERTLRRRSMYLLDPLGDVRLPNFSLLDFRVDKAFTFGTMRIIPSMDIFNLINANTVLARRRLQRGSSRDTAANDISGIVAPRVIRFGARVTW